MLDDHLEVTAKGAPCGRCCKTRYILAILGSLGMAIIYGLKVNLHVAIVAMVNNTALESGHKSKASGDCNFGSSDSAEKPPEDGPFEWSTNVKGLLLSAYFWGYFVTQIPGGMLAESISAKWVMFSAVLLNIACVALAPVMANLHYGGLLFLRILQGVGGGVTFPAMHVLLAHWAPPNERSVMSNLTYAGTALGTVIYMLSAGVISDELGWKWVFYIQGGVSAIWLLFWFVFVSDTPYRQRLMRQSERDFILNEIKEASGGEMKVNPPMPWKATLTSPAFIAILVAHTCSNWGWYMVLIELPQYMKDVLSFAISENALLTATPFLTMFVFSMILSKILDMLMSRKKISTRTARKSATLVASVIPALCFVALCFIGCQRTLAVVLMTLAVTACGGMFSGFLSNHIDIAPDHAGTLIAITNTVATIPGILVPMAVGWLTHSDPGIASWRILFYITITLFIIEAVVFTIWAKGEVQPWN